MQKGTILKIPDFYSKSLNNSRIIRVYLPAEYDQNQERYYPVIYMHDGQWAFDSDFNANGIADRLIDEGKIPPLIIIGIDCNEKNRRCEMCHNTPLGVRRMGKKGFVSCYSFNGQGQGIAYENFIIDELKPYIDSHFRTISYKDNTAIVGSSMGGIVSFRIGMRRPDVFGKIGILSPAMHWEDDEFYNSLQNGGQKIWHDAGKAEAYYVDNNRELLKIFKGLGYKQLEDLMFYIQPDAQHKGEYFGQRLVSAMLWFYGQPSAPVSCEILCRDTVSVGGHKTTLNTILQFENGIKISDIDAQYQAEPKGILDVASTGEITAYHSGEADIIYCNGNLKASKHVTVVNSLSEHILLDISVTVPQNTPENDMIFYHYFMDQVAPMQKLPNGLWNAVISIPRDWEFDGFFARSATDKTSTAERSADGKLVERRIAANENQKHSYCIEKWTDL